MSCQKTLHRDDRERTRQQAIEPHMIIAKKVTFFENKQFKTGTTRRLVDAITGGQTNGQSLVISNLFIYLFTY